MKPLHLVLGAHNSIITHSSEAHLEYQYDIALKPLLKTLYNAPAVPLTLYYSGPLLEWLDKRHSEYMDVLAEMVKRRQVELLGGAFNEPLLALIPKSDRLGQIERMTTHMRQSFGKRPRGAWLPGNMWDPRIAASYNAGGLDYLLINDSAADFSIPGDIPNPILTEDQGKTLSIVPVSVQLTQKLFTSPVEDCIASLKRFRRNFPASADVTAVLFFDGTLQSMLGEEDTAAVAPWLSQFLQEIQNESGEFTILHPTTAVNQYRLPERRYAPVSSLYSLLSSSGMGTGKEIRNICRDRSFRSIMERYPEVARLYSRMQHTYVLVNQVRGDKYRKQAAREELWRGQRHWVYWPNQSGGIYNSALRKDAYAALIEAEKTTRERGVFIPAISRVDVDLDGTDEVLFQGNEINAYLHTRGAHLFELDVLNKNWNYLDTIQRQWEPFHDSATISAGYDDWQRGAFVDHVLMANQTMEAFARGTRHQLYETTGMTYVVSALDKDRTAVTLRGISEGASQKNELVIEKTYRFAKSRIDVEYRFENISLQSITGMLAVEVNLSFESLGVGSLRINTRQGRERSEISPDSRELENVADITFQDLHNNLLIQISPSERSRVWSFPVEAVGLRGPEPQWFYQSNCLVFTWPLDLASGAERVLAFSLKIDRLRSR
jgi:hypothetical protein